MKSRSIKVHGEHCNPVAIGKYRSRGFAIVATVSVLALVMMIALAMLSLTTVSTKSEDISLHRERAKSNARMALANAIAQLQRTMGPDQRISAPADIVDRRFGLDRGKMVGTWRSWENQNDYLTSPPTDASGNEISYDEAKAGRYLEWLVSASDQTDYELRVDATNGVRLLGASDGTGDSAPMFGQVINVDGNGGYAYLTVDEGTKQYIGKKPYFEVTLLYVTEIR